MTKRENLTEKAKEIYRKAENSGAETEFIFKTTWKRYMRQIQTLEELEKEIEKEGYMVKKEYVKNRKNLYINPAVTEYNRTATAANQTVQTLLKIIESSGDLSLAAMDEDEEL